MQFEGFTYLEDIHFFISWWNFFSRLKQTQKYKPEQELLKCCISFKPSSGRPSIDSDQRNWDFTSAGMSNVIKNVFKIIEILEFITGICWNEFIALVLCADSLKSKNISLFDLILTCLAISRIGMIFLIFLDGIRIVFSPGIFESHQVLEVNFYFFWNLNNSLGTWCATCLSVFYFLKLSNFSHPFFLWLKCRRSRVVFTILLGFCLSLILIFWA